MKSSLAFNDTWSYPKLSLNIKEILKKCTEITPLTPTEPCLVDEHIQRSELFPIKFPIDTVRLKSLKTYYKTEELNKNIVSSYPLLHERVLILICEFLHLKRKHGSDIEKSLYANMTAVDFVDRLLQKRAVIFMGSEDFYKLLSGKEGKGGWENIGKPKEIKPLVLENCLSYDELKLSALLYTSGYTYFINNGSRSNSGIRNMTDVQEHGVIIGSIGTRLEKEFVMDWQDLIIDKNQNTDLMGYGLKNESYKSKWVTLWTDFFQTDPILYESLTSTVKQTHPTEQSSLTDTQTRFLKMADGNYFDNLVYTRRLVVAFDSALLEANARGRSCGSQVYLNIIGLGLGVWKLSSHQNDIYVLSFLERLNELLESNLLDNIEVVNFAYIRTSPYVEDIFKTSPKISNNNDSKSIKITSINREPSLKIDDKLLLVTIYPWDGNAHPGNEFWLGSLTGSGDPAAACSTQVTELHNAHINKEYIAGKNLHVCGRYGLKHIGEYCRDMLND